MNIPEGYTVPRQELCLTKRSKYFSNALQGGLGWAADKILSNTKQNTEKTYKDT